VCRKSLVALVFQADGLLFWSSHVDTRFL
jgi:hypothetical protein